MKLTNKISLSFLFGSLFLSLVIFLTIISFNKSCPVCEGCNINLEVEEFSQTKVTSKHFDIKGAVKNEGVYIFSDGETINDAITRAGGKNKDAYTDNLNLSKKLTDEMVIYVFTNKEIKNSKKVCVCEQKYEYIKCNNNDNSNEEESADIENFNSSTSTKEKTGDKESIITIKEESVLLSPNDDSNSVILESSKEEDNKISINYATVEELTKIEGLGEVKAKAIITYREENGLFNSLEELLKVKGIGQKVYEKIKDYLEL